MLTPLGNQISLSVFMIIRNVYDMVFDIFVSCFFSTPSFLILDYVPDGALSDDCCNTLECYCFFQFLVMDLSPTYLITSSL